MPIYEYVCSKCSNEFEKLVFGSDPEVECPSCASLEVSRKFSVFGVKSSGTFVSSASNASCAGCSSGNCSSCH